MTMPPTAMLQAVTCTLLRTAENYLFCRFLWTAFILEKAHLLDSVGIDRSTWSTLHKKSFCLFSKRYFHSDLWSKSDTPREVPIHYPEAREKHFPTLVSNWHCPSHGQQTGSQQALLTFKLDPTGLILHGQKRHVLWTEISKPNLWTICFFSNHG